MGEPLVVLVDSQQEAEKDTRQESRLNSDGGNGG